MRIVSKPGDCSLNSERRGTDTGHRGRLIEGVHEKRTCLGCEMFGADETVLIDLADNGDVGPVLGQPP